MITRITIRNFKGIREIVNLPLSGFHALVGPNGSGKTTFLDAIEFVGDCLKFSPREAVEKRGITNFEDLTWMRRGGRIEIALLMKFSDRFSTLSQDLLFYNFVIAHHPDRGIVVEREELDRAEDEEFLLLISENVEKLDDAELLLFNPGDGISAYKLEFGEQMVALNQDVVSDRRGKPNVGRPIRENRAKSGFDTFQVGFDKLALALIPPDERRYPTANSVLRFLRRGVRPIRLDSRKMHFACPATDPAELKPDGTNLPRAVGRLFGERSGRGPHWADRDSDLGEWIDHMRYALPDMENVGWGKLAPNNDEYLMVRYKGGLEVPSWLLSDGTLRVLALTIPAFLAPESSVYMVEGPEHCVHPLAMEIILKSLSFIPGSQSLITTHSPLVVAQCEVKSLLCFWRDDTGAHVTPACEHPVLKAWKGVPSMEDVFAAGVLT